MSRTPSTSLSSGTPLIDPDAPTPRTFFGLSVAQVLGSALAAATSALAASFLGVAGTIIGALVGSLVATVGSAVYAHSLETAGARLRVVRVTVVDPAGRPTTGPGSLPLPAPTVVPPSTPSRPSRRWVRRGAVLVAGAGLALGGITLVEQVLGHPVSSRPLIIFGAMPTSESASPILLRWLG